MRTKRLWEYLPKIARYAGPLGLMSAGALFLLLPVAGIACGDYSRPTQLCFSGGQLITGELDLNMDNFEASDRSEWAELIMFAIDLPSSLRTLSIAAVVILAFGTLMVWAWAADRWPRTVTGLLAPLSAGVVIVIAEVQAIRALTEGAGFLAFPFSFNHDMETDAVELVATGPGFWLPLVTLLLVAALMTATGFIRPSAVDAELQA
jgi:hypothetical protein